MGDFITDMLDGDANLLGLFGEERRKVRMFCGRRARSLRKEFQARFSREFQAAEKAMAEYQAAKIAYTKSLFGRPLPVRHSSRLRGIMQKAVIKAKIANKAYWAKVIAYKKVDEIVDDALDLIVQTLV